MPANFLAGNWGHARPICLDPPLASGVSGLKWPASAASGLGAIYHDERNPPELGFLDRDIRRVKNGRVLLIPASDQTAGHGTTGQAKFWKEALAEVLRTAPRRGK
ncbi:MAG: hypothetical protein EXR28_03865 [Betaproteobacteria bacterium]|nr:hypothetical protein [Betaproteobacteria bacterium]